MLLFASEAINALLAMTGLFTAIFTTVFVWKSRREARRLAEMETLGQELSLSVLPKDSLGLGRQLQQFDLFSRERRSWFRNGQVSNILRGQVEDTEVYLFDYSYVVSTGKSSRRITQTVFFANDKNWYLPDFRLKPETWWHKVLKMTGWKDDINFSDSPDFSEKFWLTSNFEQLIREKFTPALQVFLTERPPVHLEGSNYYLIAYKPGKTLAPDAARTFFEHCCALVKMLKEGKTELLDLAEWKKKEIVTPEVNRKE
jgi:hypothetical protein